MVAVAQLQQHVYWARAEDVRTDPEFAALWTQPLSEEKALLEQALFLDGCRRPLVVWPCPHGKVLLTGYDLFATLKLYRLPFQVVEKSFPDREAALLYVIKDLLAQHHLGELEVGYLRGVRYHAEKEGHGGDRRSPEARQTRRAQPNGISAEPALPTGKKTAPALAEIFHVSVATILRDGQLAHAVDTIVARFGPECRPDVKWRLLSRQSRLTRQAILHLARLPTPRQKDLGFELMLKGKLPANWRTDGDSQTITLPRHPEAMATAMLRRLGREWLEGFQAKLLDVLTRP